jgi:cold-inducible RNA-binding protein
MSEECWKRCQKNSKLTNNNHAMTVRTAANLNRFIVISISPAPGKNNFSLPFVPCGKNQSGARVCGKSILYRFQRRPNEDQGPALKKSFQSKEFLMGKRLYVGNLSFSLKDDDLQQLFSTSGTVVSAQVIMDRSIGRSKGFGFVEMNSDEEAQAAIAAMNGKEVEGRPLTVNEARPKVEGMNRGRNDYN